GCEPEYETTGLVDLDPYNDIATRMSAESNTVAMLHHVAPVISDLCLHTLELANDAGSTSLAEISHTDIEEELEREITSVVDVIDAEAATELLLGYLDAYASESDLDYHVDTAVAYWLAQQDLIDTDTV